jgi:hypothetical protein
MKMRFGRHDCPRNAFGMMSPTRDSCGTQIFHFLIVRLLHESYEGGSRRLVFIPHYC